LALAPERALQACVARATRKYLAGDLVPSRQSEMRIDLARPRGAMLSLSRLLVRCTST